jgi:hypothetical protein
MHLDTETAFDLVDGRLGAKAEADWASHLSSCPDCLALQEGSRALRTTLKRSHLENAPAQLVNSARALFRPPAAPEERRGIRQILATLAFDSFQQPAFAGARGAGASRQVVLRAEDFDIHIRVSAGAEGRELLGQIQSRSQKELSENLRLHLLHNGERVSSAEVNDLGEFHFSFVPDGLLSLQIDLPHLTVIGALDVSE